MLELIHPVLPHLEMTPENITGWLELGYHEERFC